MKSLKSEKILKIVSNSNSKIFKIFNEVLSLLTNTHCIVCGGESFASRLCEHCTEYYINTLPSASYLINEKTNIYYYGFYEEKLRQFILAYKFGNHHSLAKEFADMLYKTILNHSIDCDFITYVPATRSAKKKRGCDHMRAIAQKLSQQIKKPSIDLMVAVRDTDQLKSQDRKESVKGKFKINVQKLNKYLKLLESVSERKILLIDDVYTTGSTIRECVDVLKSAGFKNITVLVLAMNNSGKL